MQIKTDIKEISSTSNTQDKNASEVLANLVLEGMQNKKGINIKLLDLRHVNNSVVDYFVICSGNTDTQVKALMDSVEKKVEEKLNESPWMKEGITNGEWIILDYVNVVVHIFKKNKREYYGIEELWGDAKVTSYSS